MNETSRDDDAALSPQAMPAGLSKDGLIDRIVRVDQAGEYGAVRIYQGQRAVLGKRGAIDAELRHMEEQERLHLDSFNRLIAERGARPTLLQPVWHVLGFALGAGTALLGEKAAMACTVAVEEVIDEHYARQAALLPEDEAELKETVEAFRADEAQHRDTALALGAREAPAYPLLTTLVKNGSRLAIWLSERL